MSVPTIYIGIDPNLLLSGGFDLEAFCGGNGYLAFNLQPGNRNEPSNQESVEKDESKNTKELDNFSRLEDATASVDIESKLNILNQKDDDKENKVGEIDNQIEIVTATNIKDDSDIEVQHIDGSLSKEIEIDNFNDWNQINIEENKNNKFDNLKNEMNERGNTITELEAKDKESFADHEKIKPAMQNDKTSQETESSFESILESLKELSKQITPTSQYKNELYNISMKDKSSKFNPTNLSCNVCSMTFDNGYRVKRHMKVHENIKHHCDRCSYSSVFWENLTKHLQNVHKKCQKCGETVNEDMLKHLKTHNTYHCKLCAFSCELPMNLKFHTDKKHTQKNDNSENTHDCTICGNQYNKAKRLREHIQDSHDLKRHECPNCSYKTRRPGELTKHQQTVHEGLKVHKERDHVCEQCGFKTTSEPLLKQHHSNKHTEKEPIKCTYQNCGKIYFVKVSFDRHIMSHTGEKPHICEECGKSFVQKVALQQHIRVHTGEKPYKCKQCGEAFAQATPFRIHKEKHQKEGSM